MRFCPIYPGCLMNVILIRQSYHGSLLWHCLSSVNESRLHTSGSWTWLHGMLVFGWWRSSPAHSLRHNKAKNLLISGITQRDWQCCALFTRPKPLDLFSKVTLTIVYLGFCNLGECGIMSSIRETKTLWQTMEVKTRECCSKISLVTALLIGEGIRPSSDISKHHFFNIGSLVSSCSTLKYVVLMSIIFMKDCSIQLDNETASATFRNPSTFF